MKHAFICDAIRTPFGRYAGALSKLRTDEPGAIPMPAVVNMRCAPCASASARVSR